MHNLFQLPNHWLKSKLWHRQKSSTFLQTLQKENKKQKTKTLTSLTFIFSGYGTKSSKTAFPTPGAKERQHLLSSSKQWIPPMPSLFLQSSDDMVETPGQNSPKQRKKSFLLILFYCFFFHQFLILDHHNTFVLLITKNIFEIESQSYLWPSKIQGAHVLHSPRAVHSNRMSKASAKWQDATRVSRAAMSNNTFCNNGNILFYASFVLLST